MSSIYNFLSRSSAIQSIIDLHEDNTEEASPDFYDKLPSDFIEDFLTTEGSLVQRNVLLQILSHLSAFNIDVNLLRRVVDHEIASLTEIEISWIWTLEEYVDIVRILDILGSPNLRIYETLLYYHFQAHAISPTIFPSLSVSFTLYTTNELGKQSFTKSISQLQSQSIIIFFLKENPNEIDLSEMFRELCETGNVELTQWFYQYTLPLLQQKNASPLECESWQISNLCQSGHLSMLQWLHSTRLIHHDHYMLRLGFQGACSHGYLSLLQWLWDTYGPDQLIEVQSSSQSRSRSRVQLPRTFLQSDIKPLFLHVCSTGQYEIARWFYEVNYGNIDIHCNNDEAFRNACLSGNYDFAKWLYDFGEVDIHVLHDEAFRNACSSDVEQLVYWLYSLGGIDIHSKNDTPFQKVCANGNLSLAKWLYNLGDVNIHANKDAAFRRGFGTSPKARAVTEWLLQLGIKVNSNWNEVFRGVCGNNDLKSAQELYALSGGKLHIHAYSEEAFRYACGEGYLEMAQWLYSFGGVNIHALDDEPFRKACLLKHKDVMYWLYSLGDISKTVLEEMVFQVRSKHISEWLQSKINECDRKST
jgi:hypothetical protein